MRYYKIKLENLEPLSISDDSKCQSGQTDCLKYIPGMTVRGHFLNSLAKKPDFFEKVKSYLFSDNVCFLNAYPTDGESVLIPSVKGFYEDKKSTGDITNVLINGTFNEGMKRASMGAFVKILDDTVKCYPVNTKSNMKINIREAKQDVFRSRFLESGYTFESFVLVNDAMIPEEELVEIDNKIKKIYGDNFVWLGNGKSQGFGKCKTKLEECSGVPYENLIPDNAIKNEAYMILLSDTAMRDDYGEFCGINCNILEDKLGVYKLAIDQCSTSVINIHGFNQKLGIHTPSIPMYEKGSVFKITFEGELSPKKMKEALINGIGVRRNEGFGRILFLDKNYEKVKRKEICRLERRFFSEKDIVESSEDRAVLRIVAKNFFRKEINDSIQKLIPEKTKELKASNSQIGKITSLLEQNRNKNLEDIQRIIDLYFKHALDKENKQNVQKERRSLEDISSFVKCCLSEDIMKLFNIKKEDVFGWKLEELFTPNELMIIRISYISELAKYSRKGN